MPRNPNTVRSPFPSYMASFLLLHLLWFGLSHVIVTRSSHMPRGWLACAAVDLDLTEYRATSGVEVQSDGEMIQLRWPAGSTAGGQAEHGVLVLNLDGGAPLIREMSLHSGEPAVPRVLVRNADPVTLLSVGSREGRREANWVVFFDKVWKRPYQTHRAQLDLKRAAVISRGRRATVVLGDITASDFQGTLELTVYCGARLVHFETVVKTNAERRAILYDAGLVSAEPLWTHISWMDTSGEMQRAAVDEMELAREMAVRHRTILASHRDGTVAIFPPPHQFFYPLDFSDNLRGVWSGKNYRGREGHFGFGVRQHPEGDQRFVPWFNAPPGTDQRLGIFVLLGASGDAETLKEVLRFTRGDRFSEVAGYRTFTSHYHFAHTVQAMRRHQEGRDPAFIPDFVGMFKEMGVEMVHLAEFHGDGDPRDPGPKRLPQLRWMHEECRRLSQEGLLVLPGEEPNVHFGGHWIDLFPKPVYWIMSRRQEEPFVEQHPTYGTVYRVGNANEMLELLEREGGLAWTAHPRIKSSYGYPDRHRQSEFFRSQRWLGAAWKAMPADLSRPRLGERVLDLLDDMANWGEPKYVLGEVDVFKVDWSHELYGHMNVNYLRLDKIPRFEDGWRPVLDALRGGQFFVTTGEIVLPHFTVGGRQSGDTLRLTDEGAIPLELALEWTFPLNLVEVISGDGQHVYREEIDMSDTPPFGKRLLRHRVALGGRKWVRIAAWDIAANGAFSQPIWLVE